MYLKIIITILVLTQIIRLMQNTMQLKNMDETHEQNRIVVEDWNKAIERLNEVLDEKEIK